jgi:hypothetical protein
MFLPVKINVLNFMTLFFVFIFIRPEGKSHISSSYDVTLSLECEIQFYYLQVSRKENDFRKTRGWHEKCALIFSATLAWNFPQSKKSSKYFRKRAYVSVLIQNTDFYDTLICLTILIEVSNIKL